MYFGVHFTLDNIMNDYRSSTGTVKVLQREIEPNNLKKKKDKDKFETVWFLAATLTSKNTIRKETSFILWKILIQ